MNLEYLFYAILIGIIPALLWLWVWLHEDTAHPEPKSMVAISFVAGMFAAPLAVIGQQYAELILPNAYFLFHSAIIPWYIVLWVIIEEVLKFGASFYALHSRVFDEPIDAMIYLITASLGFVAVENTLFGIKNFIDYGLKGFIEGGIFRIIGPSLLHVIASGIVGLSISLTFYANRKIRIFSIISGIIIAIIVHSFYNFYIITKNPTLGVRAFISVWILAVILAIWFEIVKRIRMKIPTKPIVSE